MGNLADADITQKDMIEYLNNDDDFALELFVLNKTISKGFSSTHGGFYTDPVSNKSRQYDVKATKGWGPRKIALIIECKCLGKNYPLLISRLKRSKNESYHNFLISEGQKMEYSHPRFFACKIAQLDGHESFYKPDEFVGKSMTQVGRSNQGDFKKGDAETYDKWSQALCSAQDIIIDSLKPFGTGEVRVQTAIVPILVVSNGTLWSVDYSNDGATYSNPSQVDEAQYYVDKKYELYEGASFKISHLHIFTKDGFSNFIENISTQEIFWRKMFYF